MAEAKGKVCHYTDVPAVAVGDQGPGASLRWLIDDAHDGAPVYALRMVEIEPGGHSPHHLHGYEHENFVVEGRGRVFMDGVWHDLKAGRRRVRAGGRRARVRQRRRHDVQVPVRDPGGEAQAEYIGAIMRWRGAVFVTVAVALIRLSTAPAAAQAVAALPAQGSPADAAAAIDKIFERWDRTSSAGCAVGVSAGGQVVHAKGYGMANLEYGVRIWPSTVFESGSVAKQFTAAAINLLAQDGKLSIDDPVRKYVPELPDFGTPILIRHFLNHTSGLRSQWPMLSLAGRPPGSAVHTVPEILELVSHYKDLNFKPGDEYLYNNTGFTLLGVIVERVSGKSLNQFSQERLFGPLGMTRTQWREDFTAIVQNRATAYRLAPGGGFRTYMPFTNVIGNGGLLTTVGDLLTWNDNLDRPRVGGQDLVDGLQTRGRLNDGFENEYAQGPDCHQLPRDARSQPRRLDRGLPDVPCAIP